MNKLSIVSVLLCGCALVGCQTRITAEKFPEQVLPIEEKVTVNGEDRIITKQYQIASGGWYATVRSPLYADEALEGLDLGVHTNGSVTLSLGKYRRDLSTNSVVMVERMFSGGAQLATAIGDAYVKIAGGGAQASAVLGVVKSAYSAFTGGGGDTAKANVTVDEAAKTFTVSDGNVCTTCTADGNCTTGACTECTLPAK